MLAKLTAKNQLTLPKAILQQLAFDTDAIEYFSVACDNGKIILTPVQVQAYEQSAEAVRKKLSSLGITKDDVAQAIAWSRGGAK